MPLVGDGAAIQKAIDSLPSSGGLVLVPAGVYTLSAPLNVKANVTLRACGPGNTILRAAIPGLSSPLVRPLTPASLTEALVVRDLSLDNLSSLMAGGIGVDLTRVRNGIIRNVEILNCEVGVRFAEACFHCALDTAQIANCATGVLVTGTTESPTFVRLANITITQASVGIQVDAMARLTQVLNCAVVRLGSPANSALRTAAQDTQVQGLGVVGANIGVEILSQALRFILVSPYFESVTTPISNAGTSPRVVVGEDAGMPGMLRCESLILGGSSTSARLAYTGTDLASLVEYGPSYNDSEASQINVRGAHAEALTWGRGVVLRSPNGTRYRIRVDASNNVYTQLA
jgi:hypothetical protein